MALEELLRQPPIWQPGQQTSSRPSSRAGGSTSPVGVQHLSSAMEELLAQPPAWQPAPAEAAPHFMAGSVRAEQMPSLHHAETVAVRAEESTESEASSSEDELDASSRRSSSIMVSINPSGPPPAPGLQLSPRLEAPPAKANPWGPSPRLRQEESPDPALRLEAGGQHPVFAHSASSFQAVQPVAPSLQERLEGRETSMQERSFQDPAFATFHEEKEKERQKQKKKGFFSFFKKSSKKKQPYGDDFIHIERRLELEDDEGDGGEPSPELEGDQSPRFHILQPDTASTRPSVPMPGSVQPRNLFPEVEPMVVVQEAMMVQEEEAVMQEEFTEEEVDAVAPLAAALERRPSAARPTDIDDLILKHNTKMNSYSGGSMCRVKHPMFALSLKEIVSLIGRPVSNPRPRPHPRRPGAGGRRRQGDQRGRPVGR
jgi:hypothetical protein